MTDIPGDGRLAYVVQADAWYYPHAPHRDELGITVEMENRRGGGVFWEFSVYQYRLGGHGDVLKLEMFGDAFAAFGMIPEFFEACRATTPRTLDEVRAILDGMRALDITEREQVR